MSIASELVSLYGDLNDAEAKIVEKGGTVAHSGTSFLATNIDTIPQGGEKYITTLNGDGTYTLDTSSLSDGVYHGKKSDTTPANYYVVGFYLVKQGLMTTLMCKNNVSAYRRAVSDNGMAVANSNGHLFVGTYAINSIVDEMEY